MTTHTPAANHVTSSSLRYLMLNRNVTVLSPFQQLTELGLRKKSIPLVVSGAMIDWGID